MLRVSPFRLALSPELFEFEDLEGSTVAAGVDGPLDGREVRF